MTNEPPVAPDPPPSEPAATTPTAGTATQTGLSGEMMLTISGILILGVYVVFGLIADEWYPPFLQLVAATFALILARTASPPAGSGLSTKTLLKIVGYVIAVAGLWDFVSGLRFGWGGFVDVIAWLILGVAAVLGFLGSRAIEA